MPCSVCASVPGATVIWHRIATSMSSRTEGISRSFPSIQMWFTFPITTRLVVFAPPRPGFAIAGAIRFGPGITIGAAFGGWGWWLGSGFLWPSHTILIDRRPWTRVWINRVGYVHPYGHPWVRPAGPRVEVHRAEKVMACSRLA